MFLQTTTVRIHSSTPGKNQNIRLPGETPAPLEAFLGCKVYEVYGLGARGRLGLRNRYSRAPVNSKAAFKSQLQKKVG